MNNNCSFIPQIFARLIKEPQTVLINKVDSKPRSRTGRPRPLSQESWTVASPSRAEFKKGCVCPYQELFEQKKPKRTPSKNLQKWGPSCHKKGGDFETWWGLKALQMWFACRENQTPKWQTRKKPLSVAPARKEVITVIRTNTGSLILARKRVQLLRLRGGHVPHANWHCRNYLYYILESAPQAPVAREPDCKLRRADYDEQPSWTDGYIVWSKKKLMVI